MRSLSWIVVVLALILSWNYFEKSEGLSWENQVSIQLGLRDFIRSYIQTELPQATNIEFVSLWSERVSKDEVRVHFEYFFDHPAENDITRMQLKGSANLTPIESNPSSGWELGQIKIDAESLNFLRGSWISNSPTEEDQVE